MIEPTGERYAEYCEITERIDARIETILAATEFQSHHRGTVRHPDFAYLVETFGETLVPYLFHRLTEHGANWVILLLLSHIIPDEENPIKEHHRGCFYGIIADWLTWYVDTDNRYRKIDNIYHGLVN